MHAENLNHCQTIDQPNPNPIKPKTHPPIHTNDRTHAARPQENRIPSINNDKPKKPNMNQRGKNRQSITNTINYQHPNHKEHESKEKMEKKREKKPTTRRTQ